MPAPTIDALPVAPTPADSPAVFNSRAFSLVAALAAFVTQINALVTWLNSNAGVYVIATDSTTNYDVLAADIGKYIRMTNAAAKTITVRPDATHALPVGGIWNFRNAGAGDATLVAGDGVTITANAGGSLVFAQNAAISLVRVATNQFDVIGQTVAA
jgi:hypothetical protein